MLVAPERRMSSWVSAKIAAAVQATTCSKLAGDPGSGRMTGVDYIVKNSVDGVFTEDERQG